MSAIAQGLSSADLPDWMDPMLAVLTDRRFSDDGWIFERKLDGERVLVFREGDRLRLMSRNRTCLNGTYPELVDALLRQPARDYVADGEVVAFDGGVTDFSRLQGRMQIRDPDAARQSGIDVFLYLFDLMRLDSDDMTDAPLRRRKSVLKDALDFADPLRFTPHRNADGEAYYAEACDRGWEGLIAKRADAPWVRPEYVAEIGFTEWTANGRLRHPRFLGLRRDKPAWEVVRERAEDA